MATMGQSGQVIPDIKLPVGHVTQKTVTAFESDQPIKAYLHQTGGVSKFNLLMCIDKVRDAIIMHGLDSDEITLRKDDASDLLGVLNQLLTG